VLLLTCYVTKMTHATLLYEEDGTFVGLKDDKDAMGNPHAIIPYDPIVGAQF